MFDYSPLTILMGRRFEIVPLFLQAMAQKEGVQIHSHDVIYRFLDDVKAVMSSHLPTAFKETMVGEAQTLQVGVVV